MQNDNIYDLLKLIRPITCINDWKSNKQEDRTHHLLILKLDINKVSDRQDYNCNVSLKDY